MQPTTALGHNNPPSETKILQSRLREAHAKLLDTADTLCADVNELPTDINTDEAAGAFNDIIKLITGARKNLETARVAEKEPFLSQGRAVDGFFKITIDKLDAAMRKAKEPLDGWLRRKAAEERRRREEEEKRLRDQQEAERQAALLLQQAGMKKEAAAMIDQSSHTAQEVTKAAAQVAAKPAQISAVRSNTGALAQLRTVWKGKITDINALDLEKLRHHLNPDDVQKAVNSYVRAGGRELAGAKIEEISETIVR